jgi:membrane-associated protease RseP (regulator of RpoE activity)
VEHYAEDFLLFQLEFLLPLLPWLIILLAWLILFVLDATVQLEKYGIEVGPFMLMARTKRFNNFLNRIGKWHPRAWQYLWSGFVGVCFIFSIIGFFLFGLNLWEFVRSFTGDQAAVPGPIVPLVPGVTMSFSFFAMLLVPLIISIVFHELAHGVAARADDIPVQSSGLFVLLFLFGAFVEPDEEYMKVQAPRTARVRMYAAGSGANLTLALVGFLMLTFLVMPPQGVLIVDTAQGTPADGVLTPWTVITQMNDTIIYSEADLSAFLENASPGDLVHFTANGQEIDLVLGSHPANSSLAYIGIFLRSYTPLVFPLSSLGPAWGIEFIRSISWFFIIALSLAIMNLLPIPPLDGDRLFKELIDVTISLERRSGRALLWALRVSALSLLILNIVFTFLRPDLLALLFG